MESCSGFGKILTSDFKQKEQWKYQKRCECFMTVRGVIALQFLKPKNEKLGPFYRLLNDLSCSPLMCIMPCHIHVDKCYQLCIILIHCMWANPRVSMYTSTSHG